MKFLKSPNVIPNVTRCTCENPQKMQTLNCSIHEILLMEEILHQLRLEIYPSIFLGVLYITGGYSRRISQASTDSSQRFALKQLLKIDSPTDIQGVAIADV